MTKEQILNDPSIKYSIIPKLHMKLDEISIHEQETLVISIDPNKYDINTAKSIYNVVDSCFPDNSVILIFDDGVELGLLTHD